MGDTMGIQVDFRKKIENKLFSDFNVETYGSIDGLFIRREISVLMAKAHEKNIAKNAWKLRCDQ